jgi:Flp pilus assembly pilin Flp
LIRTRLLAVAVRLETLLNRPAARRDLDPERGASTVEWVIIAAVVFLLAITVGTKITSVVNEQLAKIK